MITATTKRTIDNGVIVKFRRGIEMMMRGGKKVGTYDGKGQPHHVFWVVVFNSRDSRARSGNNDNEIGKLNKEEEYTVELS